VRRRGEHLQFLLSCGVLGLIRHAPTSAPPGLCAARSISASNSCRRVDIFLVVSASCTQVRNWYLLASTSSSILSPPLAQAVSNAAIIDKARRRKQALPALLRCAGLSRRPRLVLLAPELLMCFARDGGIIFARRR
jgi:hypothetical protein